MIQTKKKETKSEIKKLIKNLLKKKKPGVVVNKSMMSKTLSEKNQKFQRWSEREKKKRLGKKSRD